jgi:hypothetical protein
MAGFHTVGSVYVTGIPRIRRTVSGTPALHPKLNLSGDAHRPALDLADVADLLDRGRCDREVDPGPAQDLAVDAAVLADRHVDRRDEAPALVEQRPCAGEAGVDAEVEAHDASLGRGAAAAMAA